MSDLVGNPEDRFSRVAAQIFSFLQEVETEGCLDIETEIPIVAVIGLPSNAVYIVSLSNLLNKKHFATFTKPLLIMHMFVSILALRMFAANEKVFKLFF